MGGEMAITTFAELEKEEKPTFETLSAVLKEYAESGAAISCSSVISIIKKMTLTETQKNNLANLARVGMLKQATLGFPRDAGHYRRVILALS